MAFRKNNKNSLKQNKNVDDQATREFLTQEKRKKKRKKEEEKMIGDTVCKEINDNELVTSGLELSIELSSSLNFLHHFTRIKDLRQRKKKNGKEKKRKKKRCNLIFYFQKRTEKIFGINS